MSMQVKFLGAAGTVTGSRTLLTHGRSRVLVDCGLFQGTKELRALNWDRFPVDPASIDTVVLTHAHLDHSGYLPKLVREGFRGNVFATAGTRDLCEVLLRDSARLQAEDAEYANRTGHSRHKPALPLYDEGDVEACLRLFRVVPRQEWKALVPGLAVRFGRAGHITGASFLEFQVEASPSRYRVLGFSGDVGHSRSRVLRPPEAMEGPDTLVLESTYGDRLHARDDVAQSVVPIIRRVLERGGTLMIPSFAVGRTQEILFLLAELERQGRIPEVPVILDSPMAQSATKIFFRHPEDHIFDQAFGPTREELFPRFFEESASRDDSMLATMRDDPKIIVAGAGMVTGGRILHHLKRRLPDPRHGVLFVGYQAEGSKGRYLLDQGRANGSIRIHHAEIPIEAEIFQVSGLSAHGDYEDLMEWVSRFHQLPKKVYLNHGSPTAMEAFAEKLRSRFHVEVQIARNGESFSWA